MGPIEFTETVNAAAAAFTADTYKNSSDVCVTHKVSCQTYHGTIKYFKAASL